MKESSFVPSINFALARRERIERALRILMSYAGIAEWRRRDLARLEVIERRRDPRGEELDRVTIAITVDGDVVWSATCSEIPPESTPFDRIEARPDGSRWIPTETAPERADRFYRMISGDVRPPARSSSTRIVSTESWSGRMRALRA